MRTFIVLTIGFILVKMCSAIFSPAIIEHRIKILNEIRAENKKFYYEYIFVYGNTNGLIKVCEKHGYKPQEYVEAFKKQFPEIIKSVDEYIDAHNNPEYKKFLFEDIAKMEKGADEGLNIVQAKISDATGMTIRDICEFRDKEKALIIQKAVEAVKMGLGSQELKNESRVVVEVLNKMQERRS